MSCLAPPPARGATEPEWQPDPGGDIEGTWESGTLMSGSKGEGGVCRLSVETHALLLECSPGARRERFEFSVLERAGARTVVEIGPSGERLEFETLRRRGGDRGLRFVDVALPGSQPLGAYGRPGVWVEAQAR